MESEFVVSPCRLRPVLARLGGVMSASAGGRGCRQVGALSTEIDIGVQSGRRIIIRLLARFRRGRLLGGAKTLARQPNTITITWPASHYSLGLVEICRSAGQNRTMTGLLGVAQASCWRACANELPAGRARSAQQLAEQPQQVNGNQIISWPPKGVRGQGRGQVRREAGRKEKRALGANKGRGQSDLACWRICSSRPQAAG